MSKPEDWTEADEKLHHTVAEHLVDGAYAELMIAMDEATLMKDKDERYMEMYLALPPILEQIIAVANTMMDDIPGIISREEAAEAAEAMFRRFAIDQSLPPDTYLPKDEQVH